jgi:hypothetical protein
MCVKHQKLQTQRRNYGLYNDVIRRVLYLVGRSSYPLSSGEIAFQIRKDEEKKMSNEYKIIKRLCPSPLSVHDRKNPGTRRFLDIVKRDDGINGYLLNFRGLLLYLINEYLILKNQSVDYTKKNERNQFNYRKDIGNSNIRYNSKIFKRVRKVISNPEVVKKAIFLTNWDAFEKQGFDVIDMLLKISFELHNQLNIDSYEDTYLLRRATERYFISLENFYYNAEFSLVLGNKKSKLEEFQLLKQSINEYRTLIIPIWKQFIELEFRRLNFIEKSSSHFEMLKELDEMVSGGKGTISLGPLMLKYEKVFENSISFLDTIKNERNYDLYTLADYYLVSKALLERLRSTLRERMKFPEMVSLLGKYKISKHCIYDVMKYLGYEDRRSRINNEDDLETGAHITFIKKNIRYVEYMKNKNS